MYENILQKPVRTKGNISLAARDLLERVRILVNQNFKKKLNGKTGSHVHVYVLFVLLF